jgi:Predicted metallopeptidase (DUF2201).
MNGFDINKIKNKLLIKYGFFGSAIAGVSLIPSKITKTAATNGNSILYNIDYMCTLTEDEQFSVFAHEVCHIAFNHIPKMEGKDKDVWNTATDACINRLLRNSGQIMPEGTVDMDEADIYNAEELYEILIKEKNENKQKNNQNENNETNKSEDGSQSSDHSLWDDALKKYKEDKEKTPENEEEIEKEKRQKEREKLGDLGEKEAFKQNREQKKENLKKLMEKLQKKANGAGNDVSSKSIKIEDVGNTDNLIQWCRHLNESITYSLDWSFEDAEIENGILTPNLIKIPYSETEIILDASSSISEILLKNFLKECKSILKVSKMKVGFFDTKFYGFKEIKKEEDIEKLTIPRGGGTDFKVANSSFSRSCTNKIIFTDADDRENFGDKYGKIINNLPKNNIIWVVFGNIEIAPKGGKVIRINDEDLKRLCNLETEDTNYKRR